MRPAQLRKFLAATINARLPVLITGSPGIGKTQITEQSSEDAEADMLYTDAGTSDPTRVEGMPWPRPEKNEAVFLPFGDLASALRATKPTVWLFDDIGWATVATQNSLAHLIHERRTPSGHRLPDCVSIIATTNKRTDRSGVAGMSQAVISRFASIVELEPNLDDWLEWALSTNQPIELMAFLRFRTALLHAFNPTQDLKNSPNPRTWAYAGKFVNMGLDRDIELAAIQGAVGEGAAAEFVGFLQVCRELPSFDGILLDPDKAKIPCTNPAAMFATATGLADKTTVANFARVAQYAERMYTHRCDTHKAGLAQFAVLLLRDAWKRKPDIQDTGAFIKVMSSPMGKMIRG